MSQSEAQTFHLINCATGCPASAQVPMRDDDLCIDELHLDQGHCWVVVGGVQRAFNSRPQMARTMYCIPHGTSEVSGLAA